MHLFHLVAAGRTMEKRQATRGSVTLQRRLAPNNLVYCYVDACHLSRHSSRPWKRIHCISASTWRIDTANMLWNGLRSINRSRCGLKISHIAISVTKDMKERKNSMIYRSRQRRLCCWHLSAWRTPLEVLQSYCIWQAVLMLWLVGAHCYFKRIQKSLKWTI